MEELIKKESEFAGIILILQKPDILYKFSRSVYG